MRTAIPLTVLVTGLACSLFTASAQARARVFVASYGNDSNPCTFGSPCKTFQNAVNVVDPGGEVTAIDSAGFGPVTINKAVSITSPPGLEAGIFAGGGTGIGISINVDIGVPISLRGLTIDGQGTGTTGIQFDAGGSLIVENCVIHHFTTYGINFAPNNGNAASRLSVSNSLVSDMDNDGIHITPNGSSGPVTALFNRVQASNNGRYGIVMDGTTSTSTISATAVDTLASGNFSAGFFAVASSAQAPTTLTLFNSVAADNGAGLLVGNSGAAIRVAHSVLTGNTSGWSTPFGGTVSSAGDNTIEGNTNSETAPPTYATK